MIKKLIKAGIFVLLVVVAVYFVSGLMPTGNRSVSENKISEEQQKQPETPLPELKAEMEDAPEEMPDKAEQKKEQQEQKPPVSSQTCTLTVKCDAVLDKMDKLDEKKKVYIPANGIIFSAAGIEFAEGETVFDVLKRELNNAGIHLDAVQSPMYRSVYVKGIGNLYEFDCGDSGWIYKVNGESPMHGCSQHEIKNKDVIEFVYICR